MAVTDASSSHRRAAKAALQLETLSLDQETIRILG